MTQMPNFGKILFPRNSESTQQAGGQGKNARDAEGWLHPFSSPA
jgi:hypothetical protein